MNMKLNFTDSTFLGSSFIEDWHRALELVVVRPNIVQRDPDPAVTSILPEQYKRPF